MNLSDKKQAIEKRFNELVEQGNQLTQQQTAIEQEKLRLQGENRVLEQLIKEEANKIPTVEPTEVKPKKVKK